jgi:hypothetical protein
MKGYEDVFKNNKVYSIFGTPNYCGEFDNDGAAMIIDK